MRDAPLLPLSLTLPLHSEPLLQHDLLQQYMQHSGQGAGVGVGGAQLPLKLQDLIHQVAEESVVVEQPWSIQR